MNTRSSHTPPTTAVQAGADQCTNLAANMMRPAGVDRTDVVILAGDFHAGATAGPNAAAWDVADFIAQIPTQSPAELARSLGLAWPVDDGR
jgi:hypothetical protein